MKKILLGLILLAVPYLSAMAYDGCASPTTQYDKTFCTAKLFIESDQELNDVYNNLRTVIKGDVKKNLTSVQKKWINYRNETCSAGNTIEVDCSYKINKERAEFLRDRLRECKTGHCQDNLIISTHFLT